MVQLSGAEVLKEDRHHSSHYRAYGDRTQS